MPSEREIEELLEGLAKLTSKRPTVLPKEIVVNRYENVCRAAYKMLRETFDSDEFTTSVLLPAALINMREPGPEAAVGAMFMEMFQTYIKLQQRKDPERFKTEIVTALDSSVLKAQKHLEDTFDDPSSKSCVAHGVGKSRPTA